MKSLLFLFFPLFLQAHAEESHLIVIDRGWAEPYAILVTGFGPFGYVKNNPSERVAKLLPGAIEEICGNPLWKITSKKLPVTPGIIAKEKLEGFQTIISMGVSGTGESIRVERYAQNYFYDSESGTTGKKIDPYKSKDYFCEGPKVPELPPYIDGFRVQLGNKGSAGTYVCNDTFYRLCTSHKRGYFVHIPMIEEGDDESMARAMGLISCKIFQSK